MSNKRQNLFGLTLAVFVIVEIIAVIVMYVNGFVGRSAFFLFFIVNIIFIISGLIVLLFSFLGIVVLTIPFKSEFKSYKYKKKRGFTKKGRKEIKDYIITMAICLVAFLIGFGFTYFRITRGYNCIKDMKYINNPSVVEMTNCSLEHNYYGRRSKRFRYSLTGEDFKKKKYKFTIGKYPSWLDDYYSDDVINVTYLPNTKIVLEISK